MASTVRVTRRLHFSAAHKLGREDWSREKNEEVFGLCASENWHGHNYEMDVTVSGKVDPETGFVFDLKHLRQKVEDLIITDVDHRNLNLDTEYFRSVNPTAENIAIVIYNVLREKIDPSFELKITLYETERNFVEYPAD